MNFTIEELRATRDALADYIDNDDPEFPMSETERAAATTALHKLGTGDWQKAYGYVMPTEAAGTALTFLVGDQWVRATLLRRDPANTAHLWVRSEDGAEWSVHWAYTRRAT